MLAIVEHSNNLLDDDLSNAVGGIWKDILKGVE